MGEVKWDGVRCLAYVPEASPVRLVGRHATDFTDRFPEVAEALTLRGPLILDGELVVMRAGRPSFAALQGRVHRTSPAAVRAGAANTPALFVAFDLLHTGEQSLLTEPYVRRRELLEGLELERPGLRVPPAWDSVAEAYGWTREHALEGVVANSLLNLRVDAGQEGGLWCQGGVSTGCRRGGSSSPNGCRRWAVGRTWRSASRGRGSVQGHRSCSRPAVRSTDA
ncbi:MULTISPECIES: hypothetical protein [unclassified Kitasatospora]|uniref:ATP-dependent DNA ligase n=1 Tax=unclassified Kitasatospora TaxID=2633591 RepID=UPI0033C33A6D